MDFQSIRPIKKEVASTPGAPGQEEVIRHKKAAKASQLRFQKVCANLNISPESKKAQKLDYMCRYLHTASEATLQQYMTVRTKEGKRQVQVSDYVEKQLSSKQHDAFQEYQASADNLEKKRLPEYSLNKSVDKNKSLEQERRNTLDL